MYCKHCSVHLHWETGYYWLPSKSNQLLIGPMELYERLKIKYVILSFCRPKCSFQLISTERNEQETQINNPLLKYLSSPNEYCVNDIHIVIPMWSIMIGAEILTDTLLMIRCINSLIRNLHTETEIVLGIIFQNLDCLRY